MEKSKDLKGLFCVKPFVHFDISLDNRAVCCCESWLPGTYNGCIEDMTLEEMWNSEQMQGLRQSVLDGTYTYCSKEKCPYLTSEAFPLYTREELQKVVDAEAGSIELEDSLKLVEDFGPWIRRMFEGKTVMDIFPATYNLVYDETCNLRCPSCRPDNIVYTHGGEYERRLAAHKKLFSDIEKNGYENVRGFYVTGAGDPFASSIYRSLLYNFDGSKYPQLKFYIMTNGIMLTPEAWEKMSKIHSNIESIFITMDAATSDTYKKTRVNGDFDRLLKNMEFLGKKRKENKLKKLYLAFIVQKKNYREMVDAIAIAKRLNADQLAFSSLDDWQSWDIEEYKKNAVCSPDHEEYAQLLEILRSPEFDDPVVGLGNITPHRRKALGS
ncbi:MAG TPA: radical SAM protein [Ruminiclostridium sp.]|nr:radical SAM protein [Ruminiclostridium sp.]